MTRTIDRYRWNATPATGPPPARQFRKEDVVGEVKPHNPPGIAAGIDQLVRGTHRRPTAKPQLITYRAVSGQRTRYEVLAADVTQLRAAIAARRAGRPVPPIAKWYTVGIVPVPQATRRIELWQCPTLLGNAVENRVRNAYTDRVGIPRLPRKKSNAPGADIEHELLEMAEFLRELAAELEAEAWHP